LFALFGFRFASSSSRTLVKSALLCASTAGQAFLALFAYIVNEIENWFFIIFDI
jgi:hypothetical protein